MDSPRGVGSGGGFLSNPILLLVSKAIAQVELSSPRARCYGADSLPALSPWGSMAFASRARECKISRMKSILQNHKPKKSSSPASSSSPAGEPEKPAPKFTPRGVSSKDRILVAVTNDRVDFTAMGKESSERFNKLMHDPEVQAQFGIGPLTQGFDPQHCKRIYEALGLVLMGFGKMAFKWPNEALAKLAYTEEEKAELAKPTAAALDELAPKWLRENQAIAALVLVFTAMTQNKLREAAMVAAEIRKAQAQTGGGPAKPAPAPDATPIRIPIQTPPAEEKTNGTADAPSGTGATFGGAAPRSHFN